MCCVVEVTSGDGMKENIEATLYQSGGTIGLLRKPDVDHVFVELLCKVLVSFLDKFMSGATEEEVIAWSGRKFKPIPVKTAIQKCTLCSFETKTKVALKRHYSIVHTQELSQRKPSVFKCLKCEKIYKSPETLKNHNNKCHEETNEMLKRRIIELEQIVNKLQEKEEQLEIRKKETEVSNKEGLNKI